MKSKKQALQEVIDKINIIFSDLWYHSMSVWGWDGYKLTIIGSNTSNSYEHSLEITFEEISYLSIIPDWSSEDITGSVLSLVDDNEGSSINPRYHFGLEGFFLFKIVSEDVDVPFYISAKNIKYNTNDVSYRRDNKIEFDFSLHYDEIESNKKQYNLALIEFDQLMHIAKGTVYGFFNLSKKYISISIALMDYLMQSRLIIKEIDAGNFGPFFIPNKTGLTYELKSTGLLMITDGNTNFFSMRTDYTLFKVEFENFYNKTMQELSLIYPELKNNIEFNKLLTYNAD